MPAAKQMSPLAKFMNSIDFWRLRPEQKAIASQPGQQSPRRFIAAAGTEAKRPLGRLCAGRPQLRIIPGRAPALARGQLVQSAHRRE